MGNINFNLRPSREDKISRDEKYYSIVDSKKTIQIMILIILVQQIMK